MEQANSRKSHGAETVQLTCTVNGSVLVCEDAHVQKQQLRLCFPPSRAQGEWRETSPFNSTKGP